VGLITTTPTLMGYISKEVALVSWQPLSAEMSELVEEGLNLAITGRTDGEACNKWEEEAEKMGIYTIIFASTERHKDGSLTVMTYGVPIGQVGYMGNRAATYDMPVGQTRNANYEDLEIQLEAKPIFHRPDGPSIEEREGAFVWQNKNGSLQPDGPAIEEKDEFEAWYAPKYEVVT